MKYISTTISVGEELGPVDWSHPMIAEIEASYPEVIAGLRKAEHEPDAFVATTDGGWPRVGLNPVLRVVMYDGWPYWRPTPTVVTYGVLGTEYHAFSAITEVRRRS